MLIACKLKMSYCKCTIHSWLKLLETGLFSSHANLALLSALTFRNLCKSYTRLATSLQAFKPYSKSAKDLAYALCVWRGEDFVLTDSSTCMIRTFPRTIQSLLTKAHLQGCQGWFVHYWHPIRSSGKELIEARYCCHRGQRGLLARALDMRLDVSFSYSRIIGMDVLPEQISASQIRVCEWLVGHQIVWLISIKTNKLHILELSIISIINDTVSDSESLRINLGLISASKGHVKGISVVLFHPWTDFVHHER